MSHGKKRMWIVVFLVLGLSFLYYFTYFPVHVDQIINRVHLPPPYEFSEPVGALHESLSIVDLHADSLLWSRSLLRRQPVGHVDLPRLQEANVAIQVFSAVNRVPFPASHEANYKHPDMVGLLVASQRWPLSTWTSAFERTRYQAVRLHGYAEASDGELRVITSREDLDELLTARSHGADVVGALLAVEGMQAIEGDLANFERLVDVGYRMMGLAHFHDNEVAGSAHGIKKYGLTEFGERVLAMMEDSGVIIDLAHASPATINDVLSVATQPVVVSHTGVEGTCPGTRNLTDQQIRKIAENRGVIGIGFWEDAVGGTKPGDIADAIDYVVDLVGVDHVALGSDFDGAVHTVFDVTDLPLLTQELMQRNYSREDIGKIMGGKRPPGIP